MKTSKNILTEHETELVELLMAECKTTGDIQTKLKSMIRLNETEIDVIVKLFLIS